MSDDSLLAGGLTVVVVIAVLYVIASGVLLALGSNTISPVVFVGAGNVGVADTMGNVDQNTWGQGPHLKWPFITSVTMYPTKTQAMEINSNTAIGEGKNGAPTLTSDGMKVEIDLTLQYHVDPAKAMELYTNVSGDYHETLMYGPVRAAIRDEAAKWSAEDFYHSERIDIAGDISNEIRDTLAARGIIIEGVYLRYTKLPDDYMNAVNAKMISSQQVEKLDYDIISAQKQANITKINADAEAYKNQKITESSSDKSLMSKYIDGLNNGAQKEVYYIATEGGMPVVKTV